MILIDHGGIVYVAYIGYDRAISRKNITAFKTDVKTSDLEANYAPLKEITVESRHGYYQINRIGGRHENALQLYTSGEHNIMIYEDVPCPKVRTGIKTRWNGDKGEWEKELKSGWCRA